MANAALTISTFEKAMRELYLPGLNKQFDSSTVLLDYFSRSRGSGSDKKFAQMDVSGKYYTKFLHVNGNTSFGTRAEGGTLPKAGSEDYGQAKFWRAHCYSRFKVSGPVLDAGKGEAIVDAMDAEMKGVRVTMTRNVNRMLHGDGSGLLATCVSASDSGGRTTIVLLTSANQATASPAVTESKQWNGVQYLRVGMPVAVLTRAAGNVNSVGVSGSDSAPVTIYSIDKQNNTVTLSTTVAAAASITTAYGIYMHGNWTATDGTGKTTDPYGLGAVCGTANPGTTTGVDPSGYYGNIDRSAAGNEYWQGTIWKNPATTGVLRKVTPDLIQSAFDQIETESDGKVNFVIGNHAMIRRVADILLPNERNPYRPILKGGFRGVEWNDVAFIPDKDAPPHTLRFLDSRHIEMLVEHDIKMMDKDGNLLVRSADVDEYTGTLIYRFQVGADACNTALEMGDLQQTP